MVISLEVIYLSDSTVVNIHYIHYYQAHIFLMVIIQVLPHPLDSGLECPLFTDLHIWNTNISPRCEAIGAVLPVLMSISRRKSALENFISLCSSLVREQKIKCATVNEKRRR